MTGVQTCALPICELVWCRRGNVGVTKAAKNTKIPIFRCVAMEMLIGCGVGVGFAWSAVEEVGGGCQGFSPPLGRHGCMYEKSANAVVNGTKDALRLAILLRWVRASKALDSSMGIEKSAICGVVKFSSIIGLKSFYGTRELSLNIRIEQF